MKARVFNGYIEILEYNKKDIENIFRITGTNIFGNKIPVSFLEQISQIADIEDHREIPNLPRTKADYLSDTEQKAINELITSNTGFIILKGRSIGQFERLVAGIITSLGNPSTLILVKNTSIRKLEDIFNITRKLTGLEFKKQEISEYCILEESMLKRLKFPTQNFELIIIIHPPHFLKHLETLMEIPAYYKYGICHISYKYPRIMKLNILEVSRIVSGPHKVEFKIPNSRAKFKLKIFQIDFTIENDPIRNLSDREVRLASIRLGLDPKRRIVIPHIAEKLNGKILVTTGSMKESITLKLLIQKRGYSASVVPSDTSDIHILDYRDIGSIDLNQYDYIIGVPIYGFLNYLINYNFQKTLVLIVDPLIQETNDRDLKMLKFLNKRGIKTAEVSILTLNRRYDIIDRE